MAKHRNIVVIGGGTGTSILLRGLRKHDFRLHAVITTSDTGGSSGKLRKEIGMAPPGDARQCFVALNEGKHPMVSHFNARFAGGSLKGHTLGNLLMALLWQNYEGDFQKTVEELERLFEADHSIVPVTTRPTNLVAHLKGRRPVRGESNIIAVNNLAERLKRLELEPADTPVNRRALKVIKKADAVIVGPGNLFASLTPPLLVPEAADAVRKSKAKKIFVANLMNQAKLTKGFTLTDYIKHFERIIGEDVFDYAIYNKEPLNKEILEELKIKDDPLYINDDESDVRFVDADLVDQHISKQDPNDPMKRTYIRHDPDKIAAVITQLLAT